MDWETRTGRAARAARANQSNDQSGHKGFACNALRMGWMRHFRASAHIKPTSCTLGNPGQMQQFIIGVQVWASFELTGEVCGACAWEICEGELSCVGFYSGMYTKTFICLNLVISTANVSTTSTGGVRPGIVAELLGSLQVLTSPVVPSGCVAPGITNQTISSLAH